MSISRRGFMALLAAPVVAPVARLFPVQQQPLEPLKLRKVTGRIEITEEVWRKIQPSRDAFEAWAEEELPRMQRPTITGLDQAQDLSELVEGIDVEPAPGRSLEFGVSL